MYINRLIVSSIIETNPANIRKIKQEDDQIHVVLWNPKKTTTISTQQYLDTKEKGDWVNQVSGNNSSFWSGWTGQKRLGFVLGGIGAIVLLNSMTMDTTVSTTTGNRVSNLDLMQQQDQQTMIGGIMALTGVILFALDKSKEQE